MTDCKGGTEVQKAPAETADAVPPTPPNADQPIKADKKKRRAEEAARVAAKKRQGPDDDPDNPMPPDEPRREPSRAPPARSFFPDAVGGRDPGGFY